MHEVLANQREGAQRERHKAGTIPVMPHRHVRQGEDKQADHDRQLLDAIAVGGWNQPAFWQALAYCRRTITNLCIDRYRAAQRRPSLVDLDNVVNDLVVDGRVDPCLSRTFSFGDIPAAHQLMSENAHPEGNMAALVSAPRAGLTDLPE